MKVLVNVVNAAGGAALILSLALFAMPHGAMAAQGLAYAYPESNNGATAEAMKWWASEVERRTNGEVKVNIFWQQGLVKFGDTLPSVRDGVADVGEIAAAFTMKSATPAWSLADTGAGSADPYVATTALGNLFGKFPHFKKELQDSGLKYLWHYSWGGNVLLGTGKPIVQPGDFSGQNLRVASFVAAAIKKNGWKANPVQISITDMFQGLQRGTVNGGTQYLNRIFPARLNEVIDWVVEMDQGQHTGLVIMNEKRWTGLPDSAKTALEKLNKEMMERLVRVQIEELETVRQKLRASSTKLIQLKPDQAKVWGDAIQETFVDRAEQVKKIFPRSHEFVAAYQAEIARVAAEVAAKGYPWK